MEPLAGGVEEHPRVAERVTTQCDHRQAAVDQRGQSGRSARRDGRFASCIVRDFLRGQARTQDARAAPNIITHQQREFARLKCGADLREGEPRVELSDDPPSCMVRPGPQNGSGSLVGTGYYQPGVFPPSTDEKATRLVLGYDVGYFHTWPEYSSHLPPLPLQVSGG